MKRLLLPLIAIGFISACTPRGNQLDTQRLIANADTTALMALVDSANQFFEQSEFNASLILAKQCAEVAKALNDSDMWSESLSVMLCDYQQMGMSDSAIFVSKQILEIDKPLNDMSLLSSDYNNLAAIYLSNKEYEDARHFIDLAIEAEQQTAQQKKLSIRYGIASEIYNMLGEKDKALNFIQQAFQLDSLAERKVMMGRRMSQMGDIYHSMQNLKEAEKSYQRAVTVLEQEGEMHSLAITYRQLGSMYLQLNQNQKAITNLEQSLAIIEPKGELNTLVPTYEKLSHAYETIDATKSHEYLHKYTQAKDSLLSLEKNRAMAEFKVRYQTDEEKTKAEEKDQLLRLTHQWGGVGIGLLAAVAIVLVVLLVRRSKRARQLRERVAELQQQLTDQRDHFLAVMQQESKTLPDASSQDKELMDKINMAIFDLMGRSELTAENIASKLCITSQQLRRRLLAIKGVNSATYINSIRMGYAKQLLVEKRGLSITEIGQLCGFEDPGHFTRAFKKETGMTPSQFRN